MSRGWERLSAADIAKMGRGSRNAVQATKPSKYKNVRVVIGSEQFDSKAEAQTWHELKLREKAGEIRNLLRQVPWPLYCPNDDRTGYAVVTEYIADFVFEERAIGHGGELWLRVVADQKGGRNTQVFNLKRKWLFLQTGIQIRELR